MQQFPSSRVAGIDTVCHVSLQSGVAIDGTEPRGRLYNFSGTVVLNESSVTATSPPIAAASSMFSPSITLNHSTVSGNSARDWEGGEGINNGGGIYAHSGTITCNDSTISGNSATDQGGGNDNVGATLINCVSGVNVTGNTPSNIYP